MWPVLPGRRHDRARLVAGSAHRGLVLLEDVAGQDGDEDAGFGLALGEDLVAEAGVFHIEGNHLAQPEAQYRDRLAGACGQGIEVEHEDAHGSVGNDDGDGAGARRDAGQRIANGERNRLGRAHVQLADAGHQDAWAQRFKRIDRRLMLAGKRRRQHTLGRELDGGGRTASVLRGRISIC